MTNFLERKITKDQCRDTGMAMVLLFFILFALRRRTGLLDAAVVLHIVNMTIPKIYRPVAVVWLTFSDLLAMVASKFLMSVIFLLVVTPIGILRGLLGKDSLKLRVFKRGEESVMVNRN